MEKFKSYTYKIIKDLWGIILFQILALYLKDAESTSSVFDLFIPSRLFNRLKMWSDVKNAKSNIVLNIIFTNIFLSFCISACLSNAFFAAHLLYPYLSKIVSSILLPFAVYVFYNVLEMQENWYFAITASVLFSIYSLYKVCSEHDPIVYEICNNFMDQFFTQSPSFYMAVFFQWLMILLDLLIIRSLDLKPSTPLKTFFLMLYLLAYVYSCSYSLRATLTIYHAHRRLPLVRDVCIFDKPFIYIGAKCFAIVKTLLLLISPLLYLYTRLFSANSEEQYTLVDLRKIEFTCATRRQAFLENITTERIEKWQGEINQKMKKIHLRQDTLPSAIISWLILYTCMSFVQQNFIRVQESFLILFSTYYIILEIFNSYIFVEVYRTSYGIPEAKNESTESNDKDDIFISKIEFNSEEVE
ncbi:hypothetical protein GINT2_000467 [Glugoides intestinalis]